LVAADPAGADAPSGAPLADHFGTSVAIGNGRIVVGMPGYNETAGMDIIRADIGALRTYSTDNALPSGSTSMWAEVLKDPIDQLNVTPSENSRYGSVTYYDPASRMLFVGDPGQNVVYTYVNEGLYWRPVETLIGGDGFGSDMDLDGDRLIIGAPGENAAYIFTRSQETWSQEQILTGLGGFGTSVAISGNKIVVGMPAAAGTYYSINQPDVGYNLDLRTPGGAVVYSFDGSSWYQDRLLMPDDTALPNDTSYTQTYIPDIEGWSQVYIPDKGWFAPGGHAISGTHGALVTLSPWTMMAYIDNIWWPEAQKWGVLINDTAETVQKALPSTSIQYMIVGTTQNMSSSTYAKLGGYPSKSLLGRTAGGIISFGPYTDIYTPQWIYSESWGCYYNGYPYEIGPNTVTMTLGFYAPGGGDHDWPDYNAAWNYGGADEFSRGGRGRKHFTEYSIRHL